MIREYLYFGPFHKELRRTIVDILTEFDGEIPLGDLKTLVKERTKYTPQETILTYEQTQQRNLSCLFKYQDGIVYLN